MTQIFWTQKQDIGPSPRCDHAMALDESRQQVVLFGGGVPSQQVLGDTWEWDGGFWTQVQDVGPAARTGHTIAYDATRHKTVLFGGALLDGTRLGDTWEWDGAGWTQVADTGPSPRTGTAASFHATANATCVFGGTAGDGSELDDTWRWNGSDWTQIADTGPAPRYLHAMAYNAERDRTVLFGGITAAGTAGDTWEFDGTVWTQQQDIGPPVCAGASMTNGPNGPLLFGGLSALTGGGVVARQGSWQWSGAAWTEPQDMGPAARGLHAAAFDAATDTVVLFGGVDVGFDDANVASHVRGDTWQVVLGAAQAPGGDPGGQPGNPPNLTVSASPNPVSPSQVLTITVDLGAPATAPTSVTIDLGDGIGGTMEVAAGRSSAETQTVLSGIYGAANLVPGAIQLRGTVGGTTAMTVINVSN